MQACVWIDYFKVLLVADEYNAAQIFSTLEKKIHTQEHLKVPFSSL